MITSQSADFNFRDHGSIIVVIPRTPEAEAWLEESTSEAMTWGDGIVVEPRYLPDLAEGMVKAGFLLPGMPEPGEYT